MTIPLHLAKVIVLFLVEEELSFQVFWEDQMGALCDVCLLVDRVDSSKLVKALGRCFWIATGNMETECVPRRKAFNRKMFCCCLTPFSFSLHNRQDLQHDNTA